MESSIWSNLPNTLIECVLAFLPLKTLIRLRAACKACNILPLNPVFIEQRALLADPEPGFISANSDSKLKHEIEYKDAFGQSLRLSIDFLPCRRPVLVHATAGGLVLVSTMPGSHERTTHPYYRLFRRVFYVCNPITRSSKELGSIPDHMRLITGTGLLIDKTTKGFRAIFVGRTSRLKYPGGGRLVMIYDSNTDAWLETRTGSLCWDEKRFVYDLASRSWLHEKFLQNDCILTSNERRPFCAGLDMPDKNCAQHAVNGMIRVSHQGLGVFASKGVGVGPNNLVDPF
eukprot:Gb_18163 [translate_table: standard]